MDDPAQTSPFLAEGLVDALDLQRDEKLERYVILEPLGEGAMGRVYAAYDPQLDRKVALKVLRREGEDLAGRLLREAQALAKLAHPNVVAVFDSGVVDGHVFVAMELVEGMSLRRWLTLEPRGWREVVRAFVQAGQGLHAVHQAHIIHRDFKPDNVLVGRDGRVRVADFGIARLAQAPAGGVAPPGSLHATPVSYVETEAGTQLGTPAYMSPEQDEGDPADERSDQFAFCVSLYEALYRQLPFATPSLKVLVEERRAGRVRPPPKGTRVPRWVRRCLLKGMATRREDRHASLDQLLRALQHDPLLPRLALVGAVCVVASAGVVAMWPKSESACGGVADKLAEVWSPERMGRVRQAFDASGRPYAADAFTRAEQKVKAQATAWLRGHTETCQGDEPALAQAVRVACFDQYLEDLNATLAVLEKADPGIVERAVDVVGELGGVGHCLNDKMIRMREALPRDRQARERIAAVRRQVALARSQLNAWEFDKGLSIGEKAAHEAEELRYKPLEAAAQLTLASLLAKSRGEQNLERAEKAYRDAARAAEIGGEPRLRVQALLELSEVVYMRMGAAGNEQRRGFVEDAAALASQLGDAELDWTVAVYEHGLMDRGSDRYRESARALLARAEREGRVEAAASLLFSLVIDAYVSGRFDEAVAYSERALAAYREAWGAQHPRTASALGQRAHTLILAGRADEAIPLHEEAVAILERSSGPDSLQMLEAMSWMANGFLRRGDDAHALPYFERALAIAEKARGKDDPRNFYLLVNVGGVVARAGQLERGVELLLRAQKIGERQRRDFYPWLGLHLGEAYLMQGRVAEATPLLQRAVDVFASKPDLTMEEKLAAADANVALARALSVATR